MKLRLIHWIITVMLVLLSVFLLLRDRARALTFEGRIARLATGSYALFDAIQADERNLVAGLIAPGGQDEVTTWMPIIMHPTQPARCFLPIHLAAGEGRLEILKDLIARGADVDGRDDRGRTPIMWACRPISHSRVHEGNIQCIQLLISKGADIEARSSGLRETALHDCSRYRLIKAASVLIDAGANINAQNRLGDTPLHLACSPLEKKNSEKWLEIAKLLLNAGANRGAKNKEGKTPLDVAKQKMDVESYMRFQSVFEMNPEKHEKAKP